jgi:hypothetical protein
MKEDMEMSRRTWVAATKLAVVISALAALAVVAISAIGSVPDVAVVAVVAVIAFAASWVQTGRVRSAPQPVRISAGIR